MPEGGAPYPEEIIENELASGNPTAQGILGALDAGGFGVVQNPPTPDETDMSMPPEGGVGAEMAPPPPGAEGEMPPAGAGGPPGKSALIIAVRGAMEKDKERKSKAKEGKETVA